MNTLQSLTLGSLLVGLAPLVSAQEMPPKQEPRTTTTQVHTVRLLRVGNDIVGTTLVTPKNEPLGKVEDIVLHPKGDVAFVTFSGAGSLNTGTRRFPVPWRALTRNEEGQFVLATTPEAFVKMPLYEKQPALNDVGWWSNVDRAYSKIVAERATPVEASTSLAPAKVLFLGSDLRTRTIENAEGEKLATVREIVVDPRVGRVSYVVLALGGTAGANEKMIAVPWDSLKAMPDKNNPKIERLTLSTTREKLAEAPEFQASTEGWKAASEPDYVIRVYEFYSVAPYWTVEKKIEKAPEPKN
jgi:sporulation protein YlmC with PRC-barrel domain